MNRLIVIKIIEILPLIASSILLVMVLIHYFEGNYEKSMKGIILVYFLLSLEKFFDWLKKRVE